MTVPPQWHGSANSWITMAADGARLTAPAKVVGHGSQPGPGKKDTREGRRSGLQTMRREERGGGGENGEGGERWEKR